MFDLDKAVAAWRRRFEHDPAFLPEDVRELERHVRDHVQALLARGMPAEEAFLRAVRGVGELEEVEAAYRRVRRAKLRRRHGLLHPLISEMAMLKSYLKTALRNSLRQKGYTFINVAGLAVGLACAFFILLWVRDETRVDRFHADGDRIYRVWRNVTIGGEVHTWYATAGPMAEALEKDYPEVEHAVVVWWAQRMVVSRGDEGYRESGTYVGEDFFKVFTFPLVQGNPETALQGEDGIVLSERLAGKLFGEGWQGRSLLGERVTLNREAEFTVTGVLRDMPAHSTLQYEFLIPIRRYFSRNAWTQQWGNNSFPVYVKLRAGTSLAAFNEKVAGLINRYEEGEDEVVFLQPFEDLYLHATYENGQLVGGRIEYVRILSVVAVFLLLIASINFMNLATARSAQRSKEIGVRKAVGAGQRSLVAQFMGESVLLALAAFAVAMGLVVALLPVFNTLTGKALAAADLDAGFLVAVLGLALLVGLFAGVYPALYLSSFNPIVVLRGTFRQRAGTAALRKGLVVFQFTLSVLLIVVTLAVYLQLDYMRNKHLGLDRENVVVMQVQGPARAQYDAFRQALLAQPGIEHVSAANFNPLEIGSNTTGPRWEGKPEDDETLFYILDTHHGFVETMGMALAEGRTFSPDFPADTANFLVNEETAKVMRATGSAVVGQTIRMWGTEGQVIGVVKNFSMNTLYSPIEPVIMRYVPGNAWQLYVRTAPGRTEEALAGLEAVYKRFNPGYPFEYEFLDRAFEQTYESERVMGTLANVFAVIAVLISCLGLFGLASFTAEQRTKEIGVRKVLGAGVPRLVVLLTTDFTKLVLLAILLAAPVSYYLVQRWLGQFAERMDIGYGMFAGAGVAALVIAWLTVSYQSIRAALANPVKSLRSE